MRGGSRLGLGRLSVRSVSAGQGRPANHQPAKEPCSQATPSHPALNRLRAPASTHPDAPSVLQSSAVETCRASRWGSVGGGGGTGGGEAAWCSVRACMGAAALASHCTRASPCLAGSGALLLTSPVHQLGSEKLTSRGRPSGMRSLPAAMPRSNAFLRMSSQLLHCRPPIGHSWLGRRGKVIVPFRTCRMGCSGAGQGRLEPESGSCSALHGMCPPAHRATQPTLHPSIDRRTAQGSDSCIRGAQSHSQHARSPCLKPVPHVAHGAVNLQRVGGRLDLLQAKAAGVGRKRRL